jgi:hypothetical protein
MRSGRPVGLWHCVCSIFLFPGGDISMMFIPVGIPSWLYAILFLLGEFVGKNPADQHRPRRAFRRAIIGLLTATLLSEIVMWSPGFTPWSWD